MPRGKPLAALAALLLIILSFSLFTVEQWQKAIKLQLGEVIRSDYEPGLHFKWPLFQNVLKFDARIQILDSEPERYLTNEKKNLAVDSFVMWRIDDVSRYYTSTGGDARRAADRLSTIVQKRLRDEFGKRTIREVVSGERGQIMEILTGFAKDQTAGLGVSIVDVRIKRVDLPPDVSESVFKRMEAERREDAKQFRSRGEEVAKTIRAKAERDREVMLAEASRDGQRLRGAGDGRASDIYAKAYGQNEEFYGLYRSLNAYKNVFSNRSDILLMQPDTEFFRYFKDSTGAE